MRSRALCLLLTGIASALGQETSSQNSLEGRRILGIEYEPYLQPLPRHELDDLVPLRPGSALKYEDVSATLQVLYGTGRYRDVSVDAAVDGEGVRLRILTDLNFFTSGVQVRGESEPPNASQLAAAAKLPLGEAVQDSQVESAERNVMERLRANGLYRAQVTHRVERTPATQEAIVHFDIGAGNRARFDSVKLTGNFDRSEESIVRATGWRRGIAFVQLPGWRQMTENRLQQGVQRVLQNFQKGNRLAARVTLAGLEYHPETNRVTPSLDIDHGPVIEVRTTGAKVSATRLRQLIPIYQERTVDRSLLQEGRRNLTEYLESLGYFDAEADFMQSASGPERSLIEYTVNRGIRHKLVKIDRKSVV